MKAIYSRKYQELNLFLGTRILQIIWAYHYYIANGMSKKVSEIYVIGFLSDPINDGQSYKSFDSFVKNNNFDPVEIKRDIIKSIYEKIAR